MAVTSFAALTASIARSAPDSIGNGDGVSASPFSAPCPVDRQRNGPHFAPARYPGNAFARIGGTNRIMRRPLFSGTTGPRPPGLHAPGAAQSRARAPLFHARPTSSSSPCVRLRAEPAAEFRSSAPSAVVTTPAVQATKYGSSIVGALRPVIAASCCRICAERQILRTENVAFARRGRARTPAGGPRRHRAHAPRSDRYR